MQHGNMNIFNSGENKSMFHKYFKGNNKPSKSPHAFASSLKAHVSELFGLKKLQ